MSARGRSDSGMAPAVVFPARQTNSLAVMRSLGRRGIPVIGLDDAPLSVGFFSRFCTGMLCPNPRQDDGPFVEFLIGLGKTFATKAVLFLMDDLFVLTASRHRAALEPYYHFSYLDLDVMEDCIDKRRMTRLARDLGIRIPRTFLLEEEAEPPVEEHPETMPRRGARHHFLLLMFCHRFGNML